MLALGHIQGASAPARSPWPADGTLGHQARGTIRNTTILLRSHRFNSRACPALQNIFSVNSLSPYEEGGLHGQDTADTLATMDAMVMADASQQTAPAVNSPWLRFMFSAYRLVNLMPVLILPDCTGSKGDR